MRETEKHKVRFANHPEHPISEKRLDLLDSLVPRQLEQILK